MATLRPDAARTASTAAEPIKRLHYEHALGRFDVEAIAVEGDPADEHHVGTSAACNQSSWTSRGGVAEPPTDRQQPAEAPPWPGHARSGPDGQPWRWPRAGPGGHPRRVLMLLGVIPSWRASSAAWIA